MGRKQKGRISKTATYTPEFIAWINSQIQGDEGFGGVVERLIDENRNRILELEQQSAGYHADDSQGKATKRGGQDADEAIRMISLSLQAWITNPADIAARSAFESALRRVLDRG